MELSSSSRPRSNTLSSIISHLALLQSTRRHRVLSYIINWEGLTDFLSLGFSRHSPGSRRRYLPLPVCGRRALLFLPVYGIVISRGNTPVRASAAGTALITARGKNCPLRIVRIIESFSWLLSLESAMHLLSGSIPGQLAAYEHQPCFSHYSFNSLVAECWENHSPC